jgi:peptidoglycan/xylan/chitin deacetylase (PgdA/CDA1 family)
MYLVKTPFWLKLLYPSFIWNKDRNEKVLYLTFDDGPHEKATPFVLDTLKKYNAKATFFCIGKNVVQHPSLYERIITEGHSIGNHTQHHLNGWKTDNAVYLNDISEGQKHIQSNLFRPPYGRIKLSQAKQLKQTMSIIMWDVLSGDFDTSLSPEKCLRHVLKNAQSGSIIVFHDSEKAWHRMSFALPKVLEHFNKQGFKFRAV